jgi:hypothetical protein
MHLKKSTQQKNIIVTPKMKPFDLAFTLHDCAHLKTKCPMKTINIDEHGNPIKRQTIQKINP